jgi:hypothetical protein
MIIDILFLKSMCCEVNYTPVARGEGRAKMAGKK